MSKENSDNDFIDWLDDENQKTTYNSLADFTQEKVGKTQKELKKLSSIDAKIRYLNLEVIAFKQFWYELGVTMKIFKKEADPFYSWLKWCKEEIKRLELVKMDQAEEGTQKSKADQKIPEPETFKDIFAEEDWQKYLFALCSVVPPVLENSKSGGFIFIGSKKKHKGVVCSWIKDLQDKRFVKQGINRSKLAAVLNNEIENLDIGKDGKTFVNYSDTYMKQFRTKLLEKIK